MASTFEGLKIVQLSDLHIGDCFSTPIKQTLQILNELKPDLILLTGDYVTWKGGNRAYDNTIKFLSRLEAPLGVYAVMGDSGYHYTRRSCDFCHEKNSTLTTTKHQVKFLRNTQVSLVVKGMEFFIVGRDSIPKPQTNLNIVNNMLSDNPAIVLSHYSLIFNTINKERNVLVLSGDTHGGQICLPRFLWKITRQIFDPEHIYGLYQDGNKRLYVTSGIGTSRIPFRLGVPPEVVLFEFEK